MATKTIKQTVEIKVAPKVVYDAFMTSKTHSKFTGAPAKISNKVGGKFSVWDGYAEGENVELIPGKKIVQTWRASDWPEGSDSKITITFTKKGNGTKLSFIQTGVPADFFDDIKQGWTNYYWTPMKQLLEK
jgi:activator of HSP90 ATPase